MSKKELTISVLTIRRLHLNGMVHLSKRRKKTVLLKKIG